MLFDWLAREGWIVLSWWLLVTLAGAAIFPLCVRFLSGLPDRGYTLARAAGLLMVAFTFWLLATLGFLRNTPGSIVLSWSIVLLASLAVYMRSRERMDWRAWWRENRPVVIVGEALFIVLLLGWAVVRAHQNELASTEKPMDLAFFSASQRSEVYPPNDPWMSGYAISYYYFGYVIGGMLSKMSGVPSTIGFNMNIAMLFALTALTSFGVVYNLVRSRVVGKGDLSGRPYGEAGSVRPSSRAPTLVVGLLGAVFVALMGNFQTVVVEIPYQAHLVSEDYLRFWDTNERDSYRGRETPVDLFDPGPYSPARWWWFRAARTLWDRDLNGNPVEVIDEFPQFSFLLADGHPHVMALPYAVLALGLALNRLLNSRDSSREEIVFYGLCVGALVFLNTWDNPIYIVVLTGAEALRRMMRNGRGRLVAGDWPALVRFALALVGVTVIAYLPFLLGFRSQLAGLLPNLLYPTRFQQYFLMFGPFLFILSAFLAVEIRRGRQEGRLNWMSGLLVAASLLTILLLVMVGLSLLGWLVSPEIRGVALGFVDQNGGWGAVLPALLGRWLGYGWITSAVILLGIVLVVSRLYARADKWKADEAGQAPAYPPATGFALLLVGVGLLLTLIPEFAYLRDNFGWRMNTIFKLYYQAWVMFSVASAYAIYTLFADHHLPTLQGRARTALGAVIAAAIAIGLVYPALGIHNRMFVESGRLAGNSRPLTLDGGLTMVSADDHAVVVCLRELVGGGDVVAAEAVGRDPNNPRNSVAYNPRYGRVGSMAGIPIVLGWENHERQWRGATYSEVAGTRAEDVRELYTDLRWDVAQNIIDKYGIDYILYGESERALYGSAGEEKFLENLEVVCQQGNSRVFRVGESQAVSR